MLSFALLAFLAVAQSVPASRPMPLRQESWVTPQDYPAPALRSLEEGRVTFRLDVDAVGAVRGCSIVTSSGSAVLDVHTCDLMRLRARFVPARGPMNKAIPSEYLSAITWVLPDSRAVDINAMAPVNRSAIEFVVGSDGRITKCAVIESVGSPRDPHSLDPCARYPSGSRYSDPTVRDGRPVGGRVRLIISETRTYDED